jgi:hypothetical protein
MAQTKKFKTAGDTRISVYVADRPYPIEIAGDGTYETSDKAEIAALKGTPEVVEIKAKKGK